MSFRSGNLSYNDATALFHEFGHVFHMLFSRTQYQHLAGIRAPIDFVETPSTLMEYYLTNYDFVSNFAKDTDGKILPLSTFENIMQQRRSSFVPKVRHDISFSMFDMVRIIYFKGNIDF